MKIKYYLRDLPITDNPDDMFGRVESHGVLDEDAVLEEMLERGTGLSRQDILSVVDLFTEVVCKKVQGGFNVNTRLANFRPGLKGVFNSATDPFDPDRHKFQAGISEGTALKKHMSEASGERITVPEPVPAIIEYFDHATSRANGPLTPASIGKITGEALKFNTARSADGIFLIRKDDASETRVEVLSVHTEGRLIFQIPAGLTAGQYSLEVRRSYTSPADLRIGRLNATLTVS